MIIIIIIWHGRGGSASRGNYIFKLIIWSWSLWGFIRYLGTSSNWHSPLVIGLRWHESQWMNASDNFLKVKYGEYVNAENNDVGNLISEEQQHRSVDLDWMSGCKSRSSNAMCGSGNQYGRWKRWKSIFFNIGRCKKHCNIIIFLR